MGKRRKPVSDAAQHSVQPQTSIWPHPDYPLVDFKWCYDRKKCIEVARGLGLPTKDLPELPPNVLLDDWESDAFPKERSLKAFIQWCSYSTDYALKNWIIPRQNIYGVEPWEEIDESARRLVRDAHSIVRYCEDEFGSSDPPEEPSNREFTRAQARSELRRIRRWLTKVEPKRRRGNVEPRRKRGRPGADDATMEREARLAAKWKKAHKAGCYKPDFARENGYSLREFNNLLKRVAARIKRANKS